MQPTPSVAGMDPAAGVVRVYTATSLKIADGSPPIHEAGCRLHVRSLLITLALGGSAGALGWCANDHSYDPTFPDFDMGCARGLVTIPAVFTAILALVYIVEFALCDTLKFLRSACPTGAVIAQAETTRQQQPRIIQWVECYHWHTESHRDSKGRRHTRRKRVVTFRSELPFMFTSWRDTSKPLPHIERHAVTKVHANKTMAFANEQTMHAFNAEMSAIVERNRHRDACIDSGVRLELDGFESHMVAYAAPQKPWFLSAPAFVLCSLVGLSWMYRVFLDWQCARVDIEVVKEVSIFMAPGSVPAVLTGGQVAGMGAIAGVNMAAFVNAPPGMMPAPVGYPAGGAARAGVPMGAPVQPYFVAGPGQPLPPLPVPVVVASAPVGDAGDPTDVTRDGSGFGGAGASIAVGDAVKPTSLAL